MNRGFDRVNPAPGKLCDRDSIVCALETGQFARYASGVWFPQTPWSDHRW
jgi:formate dehydrogenase